MATMTVEPVLTEPVSMDHFLAEGRRKLAEKYLDTKMVAFRFEGDMDPDPIQAPLTTHHAMRDVVSAMEQEVYAFRPELIFPFMRDALARFPARLPPEAAYQGPLNDDEYDERVQTCVARLVERVTLERPEEPFEWLDTWLEEEARLEEEEAERAAPTLEQSVEELDLASMTTDELASFAMDVFLRFDADQNGVLDVWEFKEVLKSTALNFNKEEIREIMAESDADGNGIIDYKEFLPIFVELVTSLKSAQETKQQRHEVEDETRTEVEALFIKGMTEEELTLRMQQLFAQFDDDGNGTLDPEEFQRALNSADLGLSRKEINMLLGEADVNDDGCIEYDEFVPVAFRVLVDRARNKQLENEALSSEDGITALLVDEFRGADPTGAGVMHVQDVKRCLKRLAEHAELQLSRSQIVSIVADCEVNPDDGTVHYLRFAPVASGVIHGMIDFGAQKLRAEAVASLASEDTNVGLMRGMSKEEVEHIMLSRVSGCGRRPQRGSGQGGDVRRSQVGRRGGARLGAAPSHGADGDRRRGRRRDGGLPGTGALHPRHAAPAGEGGPGAGQGVQARRGRDQEQRGDPGRRRRLHRDQREIGRHRAGAGRDEDAAVAGTRGGLRSRRKGRDLGEAAANRRSAPGGTDARVID